MRSTYRFDAERKEGGLTVSVRHNQCLSDYRLRASGIVVGRQVRDIKRFMRGQTASGSSKGVSRMRLRRLFRNLWLARLESLVEAAIELYRGISGRKSARSFAQKELLVP